jgi:hypothetical protein
MASGAPVLRRLVRRGWSGLPWCSSWFPAILDAEVDDAETILGEVASRCGFTWRLSLTMWGSMWMG